MSCRLREHLHWEALCLRCSSPGLLGTAVELPELWRYLLCVQCCDGLPRCPSAWCQHHNLVSAPQPQAEACLLMLQLCHRV